MATNGQGTKNITDQTDDVAQVILQKLGVIDQRSKAPKGWTIAFTIITAIFTIVVSLMAVFFIRTLNDMQETYIQKTEQIIIGKENIEMANSWERMPIQQRKEHLRSQYYKIVRYYTENVPDEQKMNDDLLLQSFNTLWLTTERVNQNFFLAIAYIKVATNFNPIYNSEYKRGIGGLYLRTYETISNLSIVREDPIFQTVYKGSETANNPNEAIKLIVARIDDLMTVFNNRVDWVLLSMFNNEYDVIDKYWDGGEGNIPDSFYKEGKLAEALRYFHAFSNWEIPRTVELTP
jgi:hypothetical protein